MLQGKLIENFDDDFKVSANNIAQSKIILEEDENKKIDFLKGVSQDKCNLLKKAQSKRKYHHILSNEEHLLLKEKDFIRRFKVLRAYMKADR